MTVFDVLLTHTKVGYLDVTFSVEQNIVKFEVSAERKGETSFQQQKEEHELLVLIGGLCAYFLPAH